jgi:UDP-arabinose 4-epimerase
MKKVLVTGGAGYIGSHTCNALAQVGYLPITYDNLEYGHEWAVKWGPFEAGDILDRARLDEVLNQYQPEAVMHFAAFAYVGESMEDPGKYYRNNVVGSLTLLEAMRNHQINKIVFSSTCATYGIPHELPIKEDHSQKPISPYGSSKLMIERILKDFDLAHGIKSISLRYFNAAGADPNSEIGEDHNPETHLIPLILEVATGYRPHITIFGEDYDTPDGTCIRDYIHVTDLSEAHVLAMKALDKGSDNNTYNLGNGKGFSVREVIETASVITGKDIPCKIGSRRPGDPSRLIGDATKAIRELGWNPRYNDLRVIIQTAWKWHNRKGL